MFSLSWFDTSIETTKNRITCQSLHEAILDSKHKFVQFSLEYKADSWFTPSDAERASESIDKFKRHAKRGVSSSSSLCRVNLVRLWAWLTVKLFLLVYCPLRNRWCHFWCIIPHQTWTTSFTTINNMQPAWLAFSRPQSIASFKWWQPRIVNLKSQFRNFCQ